MHSARRFALLAPGLAALALLLTSGCSEQQPDVPVPISSQSTSGQTERATEPGPSPTLTPLTAVPEFCEQLLTFNEVAEIADAPLRAGLQRLYNDDTLPNSGRTARLSCDYGKGPEVQGDAPAPVTIAVSSYETADQAAARLDETIDGTSAGSTVRTTELHGRQALLITGGGTSSYVVADRALTLVVSISGDLLAESDAPSMLEKLATAALGLSQPNESSESGA